MQPQASDMCVCLICPNSEYQRVGSFQVHVRWPIRIRRIRLSLLLRRKPRDFNAFPETSASDGGSIDLDQVLVMVMMARGPLKNKFRG